jgi:hypothetical protein
VKWPKDFGAWFCCGIALMILGALVYRTYVDPNPCVKRIHMAPTCR